MTLIIIASIIAFLLFIFPKKERKRWGAFGPIIFIWFLALVYPVYIYIHTPSVLKGLLIHTIIQVFLWKRSQVFLSLSEVILCANRRELSMRYLGHLGRKPIFRQMGTAAIFCYSIDGSVNIIINIKVHYASECIPVPEPDNYKAAMQRNESVPICCALGKESSPLLHQEEYLWEAQKNLRDRS